MFLSPDQIIFNFWLKLYWGGSVIIHDIHYIIELKRPSEDRDTLYQV